MTLVPGPFRPADDADPGRDLRSGPFLVASGLGKRFAGVTVLDGVSLSMRPGEVRALIGENGAGKSTVINLLSGVHAPDAGVIGIDGHPVAFDGPRAADRAGISVIRQELSLFPDLSVAESIFAGHLPLRRFGRVDWPMVRQAAQAALAQIGVETLDMRQPVGQLSIAQQQLVEIARALTRRSRLVIMDEPTASLSPPDVARLGSIVARLAGEGVAVLYVSHRLEEIRAFCHSYTVLRDGRQVGDGRVAGIDDAGLIRAMAGREIVAGARRRTVVTGSELLVLRHLAAPHPRRGPARVSDVSLTVGQGEIVGLAGIVGAGRTETARMIFGVDPVGGGDMRLDGAPFRPASPQAAMAAGIGFVPEDRKGQALLPDLSVAENFAVAGAVRPRRGGFIDRGAERLLLASFIARLGIRARTPDAAMVTLSGGNQQKAILARWIARRPKLLIVDEPTRGIDIGAKADVHALLRRLADDGVGVLVISSDLPELMSLSDRIVVLREGRSVHEAAGDGATAEALMACMTSPA